MTTTATPPSIGDRARADIYGPGITACPGAFTTDWADQMREDIETAFHEARSRPDGAVGRGPHRFYVEIHPEQLRGFIDLVTHPWVTAVCAAVLGEDYEIVELGFDVPLPGAVDQPWHRDFPIPDVTRRDGRLNSLAFNLTGVDTVEAMGPFEIAPGTQFDDEPDFKHGMFPPKTGYGRFLIVIPWALTFPGLFSPTGLLGPGLQTTAWLYTSWHIGSPLILIVAVLLKDSDSEPSESRRSPVAAVGLSIAVATATVCGLTWITIAGERFLPRIVLPDGIHLNQSLASSLSGLIMVLAGGALALLWPRRAHSPPPVGRTGARQRSLS